MFTQVVTIIALAAVAYAGVLTTPLGYAAPLAYPAQIARVASPLHYARAVEPEEYDPHPQYSYGYDIQDGLTGDNKQQQESRDGDVVQGSYSLVEPDGTRRVVQYTADPINGFNAVVSKEPVAVPIAAKAIAPVAYAAPFAKFAAPAYSASLAAPFSYSHPLTKVW